MNQIATYGPENHIVGTGIRMMCSENGLPEFLEREVDGDDAFNLVSVRTYRHTEGANGIMMVDDTCIEIAEWIDPAGLAFMNELARVFNVMGIDTHDVIEAASSKWNFIKLSPGLVGGHCISVDPYYLIQKAQVYGVWPRIMMTARRLNDTMGEYVGEQVIKLMNKKGVLVKDAKILILGITFKENCPDIRNTKAVDIYEALKEYTNNITIYDPWANAAHVEEEYHVPIVNTLPDDSYDVIILAVAHKEFLSINLKSMLRDNGLIYDVKGILPRDIIDGRL